MQLLLIAVACVAVSAKKIPTIPLGDSGVDMPMVVVGTFSLNETEVYEAVSKAIAAGFTGAHCDWAYFNLPGCGKALKEAFDGGLKRENFFLMASVSGAGFYLDRFPPNATAAEATRIQIEQTFQRLPVDYLDHLFLHMPPAEVLGPGSCTAAEAAGAKTCEEITDQWKVMEEYVKNGKVKSLGISNFCPDCFPCLDNAKLTVKPVLNQLAMHVGWGKDMLGVWTYNRKRGIVPQAYQPLGGRTPEGGHSIDPKVLHSNITIRIGAAHNKSAADVALKWLVDNRIPLAVQSMNPVHLAKDIDLWSWNFTTEEKSELDNWISGSEIKPSFTCRVWNTSSDTSFLV